MVTATVGVIVNVPIPVAVAALKSFTGVGGPEPAGNARGYATPFVGLTVHVPAQLTPTAVIVEAVVAAPRRPGT